MENEIEWRKSLKAGDKAACGSTGFGSIGYDILTVEKMTTTQIVCTGDRRFKIDTGKSIGSDIWHHRWIVPITEEILDTNNLIVAKNRMRVLIDSLPALRNKISTTELAKSVNTKLQAIIDEVGE